SQPRITKRKIRIQLEGFGKMHHGRLRPTAARITQPQHQVPPMILLIESQRASTTFERFVREFANRHARVQVEHAQMSPSQQRMRMSIVCVENDSLLQ